MKTCISNEMKRYNHLVGEMNAVYHDISLHLGLSDSAMIILYTICDNGDSCLLQEISRRSGVSKQTINSAIRKLEKEGIVYLKSVGAKNKNVCLTDEGKQLAKHTAIRLIEIENDIFTSWEKDDVEKYIELTERFLSSLKEKNSSL
ncbi:MAG: MarR family winged helix-turn-helix transcriptional regulator [Suilimivivens sp.]